MWFFAQEMCAQNTAWRQLLVVNAEAAHGGLNHILLVGLVVDDEILAIALAADLQGVECRGAAREHRTNGRWR